MNHLLSTLPFIIYSALIILLLAKSDPRRAQLSGKTRVNRHNNVSLSPASRKLLALSLLLPVIPLAIMSNYAGILMYAGALTVIGWLMTELPASVV
ncbi:hypothetical protein CA267_014720 [Alteromonas pelagimontana]|uniref:Uncharacterized protein n=1 Tax=Alteromonas pelagimontana TaxID=1858656 RepID=A0A6M4MGC9_9ALTE|nr:hypothetical protein [Alteromonas pelagimontana]QJR81918.1 hypothetical protein CA267_014720 [Alteromonas pelagimontana]